MDIIKGWKMQLVYRLSSTKKFVFEQLILVLLWAALSYLDTEFEKYGTTAVGEGCGSHNCDVERWSGAGNRLTGTVAWECPSSKYV